jgi:hypothetical protein
MRRLVPALLLLALGALLVPGLAVSGEGFEPIERCSYLETGAPGPVNNELLVEVDESELIRDGSRILVRNGFEDTVRCSGPREATVDNIDVIRFRVESIGPQIDLLGGPLGAGATVEADGSSELELVIEGDRTTGAHVDGTKGDDWIVAGKLPSGRTGVNLNPEADGATPDVDLTMPSGDHLGLGLTRGNDRFDGSGDSLLPPAQVGTFIYGMGPGADEVIGTAARGVIVGGPGHDRIVGGARHERIGAGPGNDTILVRGGGRDDVECGAGEDAYARDSADKIDHCETPVR